MKREKAKKVLRALRKVQRMCKRQEPCTGCMFAVKDRMLTACRLMDDPANWDLNGVEEQMWGGENDGNTRGNQEMACRL